MVVYLSGLTRQKEISGLIIKDRIGWIKVIYNIITNFFKIFRRRSLRTTSDNRSDRRIYGYYPAIHAAALDKLADGA